jgi:hypothetical protein
MSIASKNAAGSALAPQGSALYTNFDGVAQARAV